MQQLNCKVGRRGVHPACAVPSRHGPETVTLFQENELVIEFRVFQFGSSKARQISLAIAALAIIFLLMFGRG